MDGMTEQPASIDEYIAAFPPEVRAKLERIRAAIREAAPEAKERMAYRMPAFSQDGDLAFFAAFKAHIGFYPLPAAMEAFRERLAPYKTAKGSVQFPLDRPLPVDLIRRIVEFRVRELAGRDAS